ncbi:sensor histidine kinase-like protein/response regulator Fos-1 [Pleomassaria siparia CBS 279.74]|uniref:Sensor histidine kinase-like protein/response regulator Fos-1 n=1 Tax=Pleomassaria siparia CBS 279.74 TaxID=1314801 RepID=A0A6G1KRF9_9PLEO|nr:sensor histidine kinase-like protein/response regulator Fos-1 [Pleomassaria siparia CBS 279.74]
MTNSSGCPTHPTHPTHSTYVVGQPNPQSPPTPPRQSYTASHDHLPSPSPPPPQPDDDASLAIIFRYTSIPTIVLDSDLVIRQVSDSYVDQVSSESRREHVLGLHAFDFFDQHEAKINSLAARTAIQIAIDTRRHHYLDHIDGQFTWSIRIVPIFRHDTLQFLQMEFRDVTPERAKQLDLEERLDANETFRMLVQTVKDYAIFMLDPQGNVATWNAGAQCFKGYIRDEIVGQHFSRFYSEEDRANKKPEKEIFDALRDGRVEDEGWRYRKDGSKFWANVVITPVYRSGALLGFSKVTRDLSERRKAEAGLISAYEEASKLKSDFLANMSHEIRTPMHGMLSALTLLLDTHLDAEQLDLATVIHQSGQLLLQVINDILDYSKLASGCFSASQDVIHFGDVIQSVFKVHQKCCPEKITMDSNIDPRLPEAAMGDSLRFRQIMQNLISNAIKFTENGHVQMNATLEGEDEHHYHVLTQVIDSGIGVPPLVVDTLFTPFTQLDNTATKRHQGTGLGLSICKSLAEIMGGSIGFHPNPDGHGSVFWFTAKLGKVQQSHHIDVANTRLDALTLSPTTQPFEEIRLAAVNKRILLSEDNPINQKVMLKILAGLGFHSVDLAINGEQAVSMSIKDPPPYHVILMDINMPIVDGVTATKMIRGAGIRIPIVAMTANALKGHAEEYIAEGMSEYVPKPVDRNLLVKVLLRCLGQDQPG